VSQNDDFNFDSVDWSKLEQEHFDPGTPAHAPNVQIISPQMLAKRVLWDVVPCSMATDVSKLLGLPPASEDVEEMEHQESHRRLVAASMVAPFVQAMAQDAAQSVVAALSLSEFNEIDDQERLEAAARLFPMLFQTAYAIIGNLMDVGLLHLPDHGVMTYGE
jgi:hypothetical protein